MSAPGAVDAPKYRIGTVAFLTGLSADTIRAWERRHGCVRPARTPRGTRLYSEEEVARLQLVRALVECGDSVGQVAGLSDDALRERLGRLSGGRPAPPPSAPRERLRVAVLDAGLGEQFRMEAASAPDVEVTHVAGTHAELLADLAREPVDALLLHLDRLGRDPVAALDSCRSAAGAELLFLVYEFAPRRTLLRLADRGARLLKGPVTTAVLRRLVRDERAIHAAQRESAAQRAGALPPAPAPPPAPPAARRFDDLDLARLRELRSAVDCECPNHLAAIVTSLVAFEHYSNACEQRNDEDALLHAFLHRETARARARLEEMLVRVCAQDGIPLRGAAGRS